MLQPNLDYIWGLCLATQENSTEVPPSPASVSSSSLDEFCRPGVPSPVSPLQAPFIEDQSAAKVTTERSSILPGRNNLIIINYLYCVSFSANKSICFDTFFSKIYNLDHCNLRIGSNSEEIFTYITHTSENLPFTLVAIACDGRGH